MRGRDPDVAVMACIAGFLRVIDKLPTAYYFTNRLINRKV